MPSNEHDGPKDVKYRMIFYRLVDGLVDVIYEPPTTVWPTKFVSGQKVSIRNGSGKLLGTVRRISYVRGGHDVVYVEVER